MLKKEGYYEGYDKLVDPTPSIVFSIASKFRNSMFQDYIKLPDSKTMKIQLIPTHKQHFNPFPLWVYGKLESFLEGYAFTVAGNVDLSVSEELTKHLNQRRNESYGYDEVAINIQHGRLNGIPGYTAWRKICGLSDIHNFTDLDNLWEDKESVKIVQSLYKSVHDIDLYIGGLAEFKLANATVGSTLGCLLADQFTRIRKGDRFWYEGDIQIEPFNPDQLESIRSTTLARIICDNTETLKAIQPLVLQKLSKSNPLTLCSNTKRIPRIHYKAWKDQAQEMLDGLENANDGTVENAARKSMSSTSKSLLDYSGDDYSEPLVEDIDLESLNGSWILANENIEHLANDEIPK